MAHRPVAPVPAAARNAAPLSAAPLSAAPARRGMQDAAADRDDGQRGEGQRRRDQQRRGRPVAQRRNRQIQCSGVLPDRTVDGVRPERQHDQRQGVEAGNAGDQDPECQFAPARPGRPCAGPPGQPGGEKRQAVDQHEYRRRQQWQGQGQLAQQAGEHADARLDGAQDEDGQQPGRQQDPAGMIAEPHPSPQRLRRLAARVPPTAYVDVPGHRPALTAMASRDKHGRPLRQRG